MAEERASIFDLGDDELDVSAFKPKPPAKLVDAAVPVEQVRAVSETAQFRSRDPKPPPETAGAPRTAPASHRPQRSAEHQGQGGSGRGVLRHCRPREMGPGRDVRTGNRSAEPRAGARNITRHIGKQILLRPTNRRSRQRRRSLDTRRFCRRVP